MTKDELLKFLKSPIAFHPIFAKASGGATAGLFLSQLFYWHGKGLHSEGWIYKDHVEWTRETCLTRDEQRGARKALVERGIIEESDVRKLGIDKFKSTLAFRIDFDVLWAAMCHVAGLKSHVETDVGNFPTRDAGTPRQGVQDSPSESEDLPALYTKSTQKNSSEKKQHVATRWGDQQLLAGVEVWSNLDVQIVETLIAQRGLGIVEKAAACCKPKPRHIAPLPSTLVEYFQKMERQIAQTKELEPCAFAGRPVADQVSAAAHLAKAKAALGSRG